MSQQYDSWLVTTQRNFCLSFSCWAHGSSTFSRNSLKLGELPNPIGTAILWNLGFVSRIHVGKKLKDKFWKGNTFCELRGHSLFEKPQSLLVGSLCKLVMLITLGRKYWAPPIISSLFMPSVSMDNRSAKCLSTNQRMVKLFQLLPLKVMQEKEVLGNISTRQ